VDQPDANVISMPAADLEETARKKEWATPRTPQVDHVLHQIHALDEKESWIWARNLLIVMVLCAGFLALVAPNLLWNLGQLDFDSRYLPQLFFGLTALVVLYSAHTMEQRKELCYARAEMVRQLLRAESMGTLMLVDPLTEIYNRRYLDKILLREMSRADRSGTSLAIMMIDLDDFKSVNTRFGHIEGDRVLRAAAELLNRVFRRSDIVIRYGGDEFLVVMPDTNEEQGAHAVTRLQEEAAKWNRKDSKRQYSLGLSCGVAAYRKGMETKGVIETADERMYVMKAKHHNVGGGRDPGVV
jgi:diguanylate cyclase (GGDEF)-like protein